MLPKERLLACLNRKETDRVPLDGVFRSDVWEKVKEYLGIDDDIKAREELGIDFITIRRNPSTEFQEKLKENYQQRDRSFAKGELSDSLYLGNSIFVDEWGVKKRLLSEGYYGYVYQPLQDKENLANYEFPQADGEGCFKNAAAIMKKDGARYLPYAPLPNFYRHGWELRGMDSLLMDLYLDPKFVKALNERLFEYKCEEVKKYLSLGAGIIGLYGDIAGQEGMLMSPDIWRKLFKPYLKRLIEYTHNIADERVYFYFHTDGDCEAVIPDLIEIGFDILDPIQPECMDPAHISREFGNDLILHGTISVQETLPNGSPEDVKNEVKERLGKCGINGGLILSPANRVQADVSVENIMALYNTAKEF